jgi:hypothetical protein
MHKSDLRDLKLKILEDSNFFRIDTNYCFDSFQFLRKNNKKINYLINNGAVVSGSRALNSYQYMNRRIFTRKAEDWDFIVTKNILYKFCNKFNINYQFKPFLTIKGDLFSFDTGYGDVYRLFKNDIDIIVVDKLPSYKLYDGIKIAEISYIIEEKYKLIENNNYKKDKHLDDLAKLTVNIFS